MADSRPLGAGGRPGSPTSGGFGEMARGPFSSSMLAGERRWRGRRVSLVETDKQSRAGHLIYLRNLRSEPRLQKFGCASGS